MLRFKFYVVNFGDLKLNIFSNASNIKLLVIVKLSRVHT